MRQYLTSKRSLPLVLLVFCLSSTASIADDLPWASNAEEVGMSSEKLNRINDVMQGHIDAGTIQGAVTAVARRGKIVHLETHGYIHEPVCFEMNYFAAASDGGNGSLNGTRVDMSLHNIVYAI